MIAFWWSGPAQGPSFDHPLEIIDEIGPKIFSQFQHLSTLFLPLKPISSARPHPTKHQKVPSSTCFGNRPVPSSSRQTIWSKVHSPVPRRQSPTGGLYDRLSRSGNYHDNLRVVDLSFPSGKVHTPDLQAILLAGWRGTSSG